MLLQQEGRKKGEKSNRNPFKLEANQGYTEEHVTLVTLYCAISYGFGEPNQPFFLTFQLLSYGWRKDI